jgi:hypothetical protein
MALASVYKLPRPLITNKTGRAAKFTVVSPGARAANGFAAMSRCATIGEVCNE